MRFFKDFWVDNAMAKAIPIMLIAFGFLIFINLMVFKTACEYRYSPEWLCWVNKPVWLHPGWISPLTFILFGGLIAWLVRKFR